MLVITVARKADWLNRFFLQYRITNCANIRAISQDICALFARYLYSTLCSWIIIVHNHLQIKVTEEVNHESA